MNHLDRPVETPDDDWFRPEAITVRLLLSLPGISQDRLAQDSGISQSLISAYRRGKLVPSPEILEQLAGAAGCSLPFVDQVAHAEIRIRDHPRTLGPLRLESPAADIGRKVAVLVEAALLDIGLLLREKNPKPSPSGPPSADDPIAEDLWSRMADLDARQRRVLVDFSSAFHQPSLALRLAREGERLAAENPEEAAELARLAQHVSSLCGGGMPS